MTEEFRPRRRANRESGAGDPFAVFGSAPRVSRVLAVCTGNVCRSPVMERLLAHRSRAAGLAVTVASAGTRALVGRDMEPGSREILIRHGVDPDHFQSTSVRAVDLESFDLVLTASEAHRLRIIERAPLLLARTKNLLGFIDTEQDEIVDPFGKSPDHYLAMERQIVPAIDAVVAYLLRQNS